MTEQLTWDELSQDEDDDNEGGAITNIVDGRIGALYYRCWITDFGGSALAARLMVDDVDTDWERIWLGQKRAYHSNAAVPKGETPEQSVARMLDKREKELEWCRAREAKVRMEVSP